MEIAIKQGIENAFNSKYNEIVDLKLIKLEPTNADFRGDYTFVVFPFLKISKQNPEQTASQIGEYLKENIAEITNYNVVKGFLNIELSDSFWLEKFRDFSLIIKNMNSGKVMVEYSSPNTNKPLHLGHIRNNLLGYSVAQILTYSGYTVTKVNLINDRGIHICKSMLAWQMFGNGETPDSIGLKGDHLVGKYYVEFDKKYKIEINTLIDQGIEKDKAEKEAPLMLKAKEMLLKWEAGDTEVIALWEKMNGWVYKGFEATYNQLGVNFDKYYYESNTYLLGKDIVNEGLEKNVFFKKEDGSIWIDLTSDGLDEKLVMRADGTSVYITQDIGTAQLKYEEFGCDKSIYVVGNEQDYHFKVLFLILQKLGKTWANGCYHLSYGMVDLPSGKMKSREGTVVDADDLMAEMIQTAKEKTEELGKTEGMPEEEKNLLYKTLGMGALKFFMLRVDPQKRMLFNPADSIDFQGDTGPFVQYTYARINSMMNAANQAELKESYTISNANESELALIKQLTEFENSILEAAKTYNPAAIGIYSLNLAKAFNRVYNDVSFLKESELEKRKFRLQLAQKTALTIQTCLNLLGITCPARM
ncbi:MAG: arginine--tRNA ligase [Bacteroidetes bacterium]|nr:arginine--tRNA ligase [Bacteroidota bacterium]